MVSHCANGEDMLRQQRGTMVKTFEFGMKSQTKKLNTLVNLSHEQNWHDKFVNRAENLARLFWARRLQLKPYELDPLPRGRYRGNPG